MVIRNCMHYSLLQSIKCVNNAAESRDQSCKKKKKKKVICWFMTTYRSPSLSNYAVLLMNKQS